MHALRRHLRLLALFARAELQYELEYRGNVLLQVVEMIVIVTTSVGAVLVLYTYTTEINGWTLPQMIVLLGVYYIVQGVEETVFQTSMTRLMEHVRLGTLDFVLLKPVNSQFFASVRHLELIQVAQVVLGCVVVGVGLDQIGATLTPWAAFAFVVSLGCGLVLVYALLLVLSTLSFWFVRVDNILAIFWAFIDAGRFPVDIYPGWLRVTMTTVVPIGVAVTVPAHAVAGRLDPLGLAAVLAGTVAVWCFAGWFWRRGLRAYSGASA
jgi:ABC-2 type transport system permease protein